MFYPATQVTHSVSVQSRDGLVYQGFNPRWVAIHNMDVTPFSISGVTNT
jgi:hypothetical protein